MSNRKIRYCMLIGLFAITAVISGCGPKTYTKNYYLLDIQRQADILEADTDLILYVRRFSIDTAFSSNSLVYRKGEFQYESDFYNEFLVSPTAMVTEKTRTWLSQTGLFGQVLDAGSYLEPTHTLEGNIVALYGDVREASSPAAIIEVRFFLIENADSEKIVLWGKLYKGSCQAGAQTADSLIEAFDRCLENILTELEEDLIKKLKGGSASDR